MTYEAINALPEIVTVLGKANTRSVAVETNDDIVILEVAPSQKIRNHSPDGFNWGYGGSGPAQLALAIMLHFLPEEDARRFYQRFKFEYVAAWPQGQDFMVKVPLRDFVISKHITA